MPRKKRMGRKGKGKSKLSSPFSHAISPKGAMKHGMRGKKR